jgi:hypothetical protein
MLEALWSVEFVSNSQGVGVGAGVAVIENGKVLGGDAQYFYVGECKVENGTVYATVKVTHYFGQPHSVFGTAKQFTLSLSGKPAQTTFDMSGNVIENPQLKILIRFSRRAELP